MQVRVPGTLVHFIIISNLNLRPLTWGKRFLLFLPDSHSAYYDSFVSALGRSLPPPHWVFQGFVALGQETHPHLQHWVNGSGSECGISQHWAIRLYSSVSRRVVKLTVSHYYLAPLPLQKRGYGDEIQNPVVFMIPSTGSGSGIGGHGMHNGCDFGN